MTRGISILIFCKALTIPSATQSHLLIPAKIFIKITFTFLSEVINLNALTILSGVAPPPTSRKFAGSPPASLIMSIEAIANPAPLIIFPILPSRPT